ncbi:hypothetical protein KCU59_g45, partial [Aureobasidium melanogenum]
LSLLPSERYLQLTDSQRMTTTIPKSEGDMESLLEDTIEASVRKVCLHSRESRVLAMKLIGNTSGFLNLEVQSHISRIHLIFISASTYLPCTGDLQIDFTLDRFPRPKLELARVDEAGKSRIANGGRVSGLLRRTRGAWYRGAAASESNNASDIRDIGNLHLTRNSLLTVAEMEMNLWSNTLDSNGLPKSMHPYAFVINQHLRLWVLLKEDLQIALVETLQTRTFERLARTLRQLRARKVKWRQSGDTSFQDVCKVVVSVSRHNL